MKEKDNNNTTEHNANKSYTILVVDDDEGLSKLVQKKIRGVGLHADGAKNGTEAIAKITKDHSNTLMLLDNKLPDMPAMQIIKTLDERKCMVPFVIMTGHGDEKLAVEMMKLGARDYLIKEANFLDLLPSVVKRVTDQLMVEKKWEETEKKLIQSEKLSALGIMASGIAHDFNNILAIIHGNAQLLEKGCGEEQADLKEGLHTICKVANDGAETVRRMNEFTRTTSNSSQHIALDLVDLIKATVDFSKHRWKNTAQIEGITYNIDLEGLKPVPHIKGSASELREVFINIINNALDAMPEGGSIVFRSLSDGDSVIVSISDSGKGMSRAVREKIFDPFFTTKGANGSGLGMSVVYGIINRHNAKIDVESQVDKGTTFKFRFPTTKEKPGPVDVHGPIEAAQSCNYRILVVDDMEEINKLLSTYLTREGYSVECVDSGREAIRLLEKEYFDLVLCDLGMPGVTGKDVLKVIETLDRRPKVGLITGWADKIESIRKENTVADFIVSKPFDLSKLSGLIREVLK